MTAKVFSKIDLRIGEWTNLGASDGNRADGFACADQRDRQDCAEPKVPGPIARLWVFSDFGLQIGKMNDLVVEGSACWQAPRPGGTTSQWRSALAKMRSRRCRSLHRGSPHAHDLPVSLVKDARHRAIE